MPIYVYKFVDTGETIEVEQSFTDDTLTEYPHPESGTPMAVKKVFQPVGVTFKGSGFYKTDSRSSSGSKGSNSSSSATDSTASGASSSSPDTSSSSNKASSGTSSSGSSSSGATSGSES